MRHSSYKRYVLLKNQIIKFGYEFLVSNRYCVYILMKKIDKIFIHFCDELRKSRIFCLARGVLLDNGVTSLCISHAIYLKTLMLTIF